MKEKIMQWNYKKAFVTIILLAVVLALVSAIAVPLSLSQQIRDAHAWEQTVKAERLQSGEAGSEREGERDGREANITPLDAGHFVLFGALAVLWLALGAVYWLLVMAWLCKNAVCEGMNKSLWPILGLFFNILAVFAFLIVRDRPGRTEWTAA